MSKRQISDTEKQQVIELQRESDGSLRCFISGEVINLQTDEYEFDHIQPYSQGGDTNTANIRVVLRTYNRRKSDQSLYEVRDNLRLERLFIEKKNSIKLQDLLELKSIEHRTIHTTIQNERVSITDGTDIRVFPTFVDPILDVHYFYGRVPLKWIQNDDQEGLQPRVIDFKRLVTLRDHLKSHPQMAPAISRLLDDTIRLFDGQHKVAAQILNGMDEIDIKVYLSPTDVAASKKLFDMLMITNLEAHSKLRQVPFYTSTLLERLSVIYRELWEEFATKKPASQHSEANFVSFLINEKKFARAKANDVFRAAVKDNALSQSFLIPFIAEASKDASYPITQEIMNKAIFPVCLYLQPSPALFDTPADYRNHEVSNFRAFSEMLVELSFLQEWVQRQSNTNLTNIQLKARRIWHKGSVLTWSPYLKDIIINTFNMMTEDERTRLLYREEMTDDHRHRIQTYLSRLFNHPMWDMPEGEIDSILVSAKKQDDLFRRNGLTSHYVLTGNSG
ncbi:MAG: hypothetical protein KJZ77_01425 [Anaerolineales bacterium]|nr:hypothetical protein [Anaerolineales bacterium]